MSNRTAPLALWAIAEAFLNIFVALFGMPADIAARGAYRNAERSQLLPWLRAGEALLRRLIAIEAAALAKVVAPPPRPPRQRVRRAREFWPDKPQDWVVSFRCLDRRRLAGASRANARRRSKLSHMHGAWPIAERVEAMLRAAQNPAPYAKRLARRLHAAPSRVYDLARCAPEAPRLIGEQDFFEITKGFDGAVAAFDTS